MDRAFADIVAERNRQDLRWGVQRHDWPFWAAILAEETGEVCKEALVAPYAPGVDRVGLERLRTELVHAAAVAVAMIEHVDERLRDF